MKFALLLSVVSMCVFGADIEVWAVPSIQKVRPDDPAQSRNAVWDGAFRTISLAGAKNEHVPFQVVISTEPSKNRIDPPASGLFVTASDLVAPGGRIPSSQIKLYFEHDILCQAASSAMGAGGFWPDALAPLTDPFSMAAAFRQTVKNRPIWIDIVTPSDAPTGIYTGTVQVTQNSVSELNVRLTLYDFALPLDTHLITYMGVGADQLARFHKVSPSAAQALCKSHAVLSGARCLVAAGTTANVSSARSLSCGAPELARRYTKFGSERAVECGDIFETAVDRDIHNFLLLCTHLYCGFAQPQTSQVLMRRNTRNRSKRTQEVKRTQARFVCKICQLVSLSDALLDHSNRPGYVRN